MVLPDASWRNVKAVCSMSRTGAQYLPEHRSRQPSCSKSFSGRLVIAISHPLLTITRASRINRSRLHWAYWRERSYSVGKL